MTVILTWLEDFDGRSSDGSARPGLKAPETLDPNAEHAPSCRYLERPRYRHTRAHACQYAAEHVSYPIDDDDARLARECDVAAGSRGRFRLRHW